ncbi:carboxy-terminal domain RNA polymerase II polypeptide A small phosphatase [Enteropsectra breve]|nr:carboxy-terminal domain RNA polymerase II polypeptide A small phosphatase [Enteropsectra breve]
MGILKIFIDIFTCCKNQEQTNKTSYSYLKEKEHIELIKRHLICEEDPKYPLSCTMKPVLVLDLDNTLIYTSNKEIGKYDHHITLYINQKNRELWVKERPFLAEFLHEMSKHFVLVVFTAGVRDYGIQVLKNIDRNRTVSILFDRNLCTQLGTNSKNYPIYTKDLRTLGFNMAKTVIVDDSAVSFTQNPENAVGITQFYGQENDTALQKLIPLLVNISKLGDVREK